VPTSVREGSGGREGEGPERKREWWPGGSASDQEREG